LLDHLGRGTIDLSNIEVLVLDEADRMFDMGFLPDIRRIVKHLPAKRQTLLFSATMPTDVRSLANELLHEPVNIQIGFTKPLATVSHSFYPVMTDQKAGLLKDILETTEMDSVLVFTRTKSRAKSLALQLEKSGYRAVSLQGNLTQQKRQKALDGFRNGSYKIMVATDIAARGIDVDRISHVINYDMPDTADAYTHRIGRTGRAARTGDAFSFITGNDQGLLRSISGLLGERIEYRRVEGLTYSPPLNLVYPDKQSAGVKPNPKKTFSPKKYAPRKPGRRTLPAAAHSARAH
jgi:ATP-dependent RNA helicase RhlE